MYSGTTPHGLENVLVPDGLIFSSQSAKNWRESLGLDWRTHLAVKLADEIPTGRTINTFCSSVPVPTCSWKSKASTR